MKLIPLGAKNTWCKNYGKYFAQVDDKDYEYLMQWKWCVKKSSNTIYAHRSNGNGGAKISMHRQLLGLTDPKIYGDHIDGNGLNNQRNNLRKCNARSNTWNCKAHGTSPYKGVAKNDGKRWMKLANGKRVKRWAGYTYWLASIVYGGKQNPIGRFKTQEEAAWAYDFCAMEIHGEFARLNFKY